MIQNIDFIDKNIKKDTLIVNPINKVSLEPIKESFEILYNVILIPITCLSSAA